LTILVKQNSHNGPVIDRINFAIYSQTVSTYLDDGTNWPNYVSGSLSIKKNSDGTASISSQNNYKISTDTFTIPNVIFSPEENKYYTITQIGSGAFQGASLNDTLHYFNVKCNDAVTAIGSSAFYNSKIKQIDCGNSIYSIGTSAFANSSQFNKLFYDSVNPPSVGDGAFTNCAKSGWIVNNYRKLNSDGRLNNDYLNYFNRYNWYPSDDPTFGYEASCNAYGQFIDWNYKKTATGTETWRKDNYGTGNTGAAEWNGTQGWDIFPNVMQTPHYTNKWMYTTDTYNPSSNRLKIASTQIYNTSDNGSCTNRKSPIEFGYNFFPSDSTAIANSEWKFTFFYDVAAGKWKNHGTNFYSSNGTNIDLFNNYNANSDPFNPSGFQDAIGNSNYPVWVSGTWSGEDAMWACRGAFDNSWNLSACLGIDLSLWYKLNAIQCGEFHSTVAGHPYGFGNLRFEQLNALFIDGKNQSQSSGNTDLWSGGDSPTDKYLDIYINSTESKNINLHGRDSDDKFLAQKNIRVHLPRNSLTTISAPDGSLSITYYYDYSFNYGVPSEQSSSTLAIDTPFRHVYS
jgi:hypothetical protein